MECAAAFIGVAIADVFTLRGWDESLGKRISVDISASKVVPSDANWSPATATTIDDEMSVMSYEEGHLVSPLHSNSLLSGGFVQNYTKLDNVRKTAATIIQRSFRSFIHSRRRREEIVTSQKPNKSLKEIYQRPERRALEKPNSRTRSLLHPYQQLIFEGKEKNSSVYIMMKRRNAAISIQSHVRGYLVRVSLEQIGARERLTYSWKNQKIIRQPGTVVSMKSQICGRIAKMRIKPRTVSIQSHLRGCSICSSRKISRTLPILDTPSSMSKESWKEKHCKESIKYISPKLEGNVQQFPASTGAQEANSKSTPNSFRTVLSFWESMTAHNQERTDSCLDKIQILRGTKGEVKQQKVLETTSTLHIQNCFRCYVKKKVERNDATQIQRQALALITKRKEEGTFDAEENSHHNHSGINGRKIREFVSYFSEPGSSFQPMKECIATSIPHTFQKVSFFESSTVTHEILPVAHSISHGIQQEDFWQSQRVMLQQRPG